MLWSRQETMGQSWAHVASGPGLEGCLLGQLRMAVEWTGVDLPAPEERAAGMAAVSGQQ